MVLSLPSLYQSVSICLRRLIAQCAVRAIRVIVLPPCFNRLAGIYQAEKPMLIQAFAPKFPVETLDVGVLDWLVRFNELQRNAAPSCPRGERLACKFRASVGDQALRAAAV